MSWRTWRPFTYLWRSSVRSSYLNREEGSLRRAHKTDSFFDNVCELDLVFNFYKVCGGFLALRVIADLLRLSGLCHSGRDIPGRRD